jgi:hypothetical protein
VSTPADPGESTRTIRSQCRTLITIAWGAFATFMVSLPVHALAEVLAWPDVPTTWILVVTVIAGCAASLATIAAVACWTIIGDLGYRLDQIEARALAQIRTFLDGAAGGDEGEPARVNGEEVLGDMAGELVAMPNSKAFQLGREIERRRWERGDR